MVRTVAPSLVSAGVTDAMPDPTARAARRQRHSHRRNDNWREGPEAEIEKSNLRRQTTSNPPFITTLPSARTPAVIHERNGQSGIGLFESL